MTKQSDVRSAGDHGALHSGWQLWTSFIGVLLIGLSVKLYLSPPKREEVTDIGRSTESRSMTQPEPSTVSVAFLLAGVALVAFAANGRKLSSLSRDGAVFEPPPRGRVSLDAEHAAPAIAASGPEPLVPAHPKDRFVANSDEFDVYAPEDVPSQVVDDLMRDDTRPIESPDEVAYGFRRRGKGNNAWFVTTKSGRTLQISYGGRGKTVPTIADSNSQK